MHTYTYAYICNVVRHPHTQMLYTTLFYCGRKLSMSTLNMQFTHSCETELYAHMSFILFIDCNVQYSFAFLISFGLNYESHKENC